jgi:hypothetical protein
VTFSAPAALTEARDRSGEGTYVGKSLVARSALLLTAGVTAFGAGVVPAFADPPGNNGTIKIDGLAFDDHPNNEPHPGCKFQVDFYGYDQGNYFANLTFRAHPPTGSGQVLATDRLFIGGDPAGGGTDLDGSGTYTLDFTGFEAHPQQGYHVKLTINAQGSQGADVKHKVFWVECPPVTPKPTHTTPTKTPKPTHTTPTKTPKPTHTTPTKTPKPTHTTPTKTPKPTHSTPATSKPTHTTPATSKPTHTTPATSKPTHTTPATSKPTHKESPAVVPTSVPAGGSGGPGAGVTLAYVGLAGASAVAAVGGALYRRRHNG